MTFFGRVILLKCPDPYVTGPITVQLSLVALFWRDKPEQLIAKLENVELRGRAPLQRMHQRGARDLPAESASAVDAGPTKAGLRAASGRWVGSATESDWARACSRGIGRTYDP